MNRLWSPWRSKYIQSFEDNNEFPEGETFISYAVKSKDDKENLVVFRSKYSIIIMNKYPYNNGHLLVCPIREVNDLIMLEDDEFADINNTLKKSVEVIKKIFSPHGYNIGLNAGSAAGAGVPKHLHYHIVPRWNGDTNFMTTVSDMKVMSQSMEEAYELLKSEFDKIG